MSQSYGNRCGHDPNQLRFCDVVKRGKGGAPQVLGIVSGLLGKAARFRSSLKSWQTMNESGKRRRSEKREAMAAVIQYLIATDFDLSTRRCARRVGDNWVAPDADLIAKGISKTRAWAGKKRLSRARVWSILREFAKCGYITLGKQYKSQDGNGSWVSSPKVITFTQKFFKELGGRRLWQQVKRLGVDRINRAVNPLGADLPEFTVRQKMAELFTINFVMSPRQVGRVRPPDRLATA